MNQSPPETRFWTKVRKTDTCWLWLGGKDSNGYGKFRLRRGGFMTNAHRAAWELTYGDNPKGKEVCHRCDNPSCVRPDHLFLGSHLDNLRDMIGKGRQRGSPGISHNKAKLTNADVLSIRTSTLGTCALARRFDVHRATILRIRNRTGWRHI